MTPELVVEIAQDAGIVILLLAMPPLLVGLAIGLAISLFQAATQIQEMTLTFIPKLLGVGAALLFAANWMLTMLIEYTIRLYESIPAALG